MTRYLFVTFVIVATMLTTSCRHAPPTYEKVNIETYANNTQEITPPLGDVKEIKQNFITGSLDMHYGYHLIPLNDIDARIAVRFDNMEAENAFNNFLSDENLTLIGGTGKKVICECIGKPYEIYGVHFFRVTSAKFFLE